MPDAPTKNRIGKYRLLGELGEGGMARVFLAVATGLANFNKLVVIKQIRPHLADDPDFVTMFLDEARLAARLNHPSVVQTNEVGSEEGVYYIAMEYLEGQALRRVLSRLSKTLTVPMKLRVMVEVLAGLDHAHELCDYDGTPLQVVHRDVSPHNVFVTYNGQVKVVDFGIAKAIDSSAETRTGMLKGKIGYMAPEQARGDKVDRRADIFAVGVMLWELVTGRRLFKGDSEMTVLHKLITHQIPAPSTVEPSVDPELEAVVMKALAADPADRHHSAQAMSEALESWLRKSGDHTTLRDVGRLVAEEFADDRARITSLIEAQLKRAAEHSGEVDTLVLLDPATQSIDGQSSATAPRGAADDQPTRTMGTAATVVLGKKAPEPAKRQPLLWLGIAAVVIGAIAAIMVLPEGDGGEPAQAAAEPVSHVLRIESRPAGAEVRCRGERVGVTPFEVEVKAGERPCAYVIEKEGHAPLSLEPPVLSTDVTLQAPLVEIPQPEPAPPSPAPSATATGFVPGRVAPPRPVVAPPPAPPPPPPPPDINLAR